MMGIVNVKGIAIGEGIPKVCVPMIGRTEYDIMEEMNCIKKIDTDIIEWRVDFFDDVQDIDSVNHMLVKIRGFFNDKPIIFTLRNASEGGQKKIEEPYYVRLNQMAIKSGLVDIIDVELFSKKDNIIDTVKTAHENDMFVIISNHDFSGTPPQDEMIMRMQEEQELGGDILKIAVMPHSEEDVLMLMNAVLTMKKKYSNSPVIGISMGSKGVISRISGEFFGSAVSFGTARNLSAPGQIPVESLRRVLKIFHYSLGK